MDNNNIDENKVIKKESNENFIENENDNDIDIEEILINQNILELTKKEKDEKKKFYQIPFIKYSNTFKLLLYALQKKIKTENDIKFISHYLTNFPNVINLTPPNKKNMIEPSKILYELSNSIKVENKTNRTIIMRFGDYGDKFYIIFKGNVSIIIKKEIEYEMTEYEYLSYLKYLKSLKENQLIEENLRLNNFQFDSSDLKKCLDGKINYEKPKDEYYIEYNKINNEELIYSSREEYIERIKPIINSFTYKKRKKITLNIYYHICDLKEGDTFGEIALRENVKRTATIICNEDCIFGILTKKLFNDCIKGAQEKIRFNNINFLLSCELFFGIKLETFDRKYFNNFKLIHLQQGSILFNQGDYRNDIYILKEGLIEITIKTTYKELIDLIKLKNGKFDEIQEKKHIKELNIQVGNLLISTRYLRLFKIEENEVIGLDDYVNKDNLYIFNAICKNNCEIYSIDYNVYKYLCERDWRINDNYLNYNKQRYNLMANRLLLMRTVALNRDLKQLKKHSDLEISEMEKKNNLNESKNYNNNNNNVILNTIFTSRNFKNINSRNKVKFRNRKFNPIITPKNEKKFKKLFLNNNSTQSTKFTPFSSGTFSNLKITNNQDNIEEKINIVENISDNLTSRLIDKISSSYFKKKENNIPKLKINELNNLKYAKSDLTLNSDSSVKRILNPIKTMKDNYVTNKIKEYKMKVFYSTLLLNSNEEEKEKNLINKIYQKALYNNIKNKIFKIHNNNHFHRRINSEGETIDKVDFLLMDKTIENIIPNKTKTIFNSQPRRVPLNYKSHSPKFPIKQKIKFKILGRDL